ncbi:MAG: mechanosensitive ion channel, partial [Candidatus Poribacteria bacterium]|nr:mechanosensitive ion channel [Candidatus Poribacteria bacterium]
RIEVGGTMGVVTAINIRATVVKTLDNVDVIVPNSQFIEQTVINWTHRDDRVRIHVPVGIAYGSDTRQAERLLLECANSHTRVLTDPEPAVRFRQFGESSLDFDLLVWIADPFKQIEITSDLNFAIEDIFRKHHITIPFPQRDVHLIREN